MSGAVGQTKCQNKAIFHSHRHVPVLFQAIRSPLPNDEQPASKASKKFYSTRLKEFNWLEYIEGQMRYFFAMK